MPKQIVPGNNAISIDEYGWVLFKRPHGTFYSSVTQAIASTAATQAIAFEKETDNEGLVHSLTVNNSRVYVPTSGSYEIIFSGIADLNAPGPAPKHIELFLAIDGTPVADSNTRVAITNINEEMTVVASFIYDMNDGQYVELYTYGDDTDCRWLATAAGTVPDRPATPSVIMTVKKISSKLSYE